MNQLAIRVIVGIALLVVATVTLTALRESDRWRRPDKSTTRRADDPYSGLANLLSGTPHAPATVRDPFRPFSAAPTGPKTPPKVVAVPVVAREMPVLTAIVSDAGDPRAVIRYQGKNYTVRAGDLFADYQVISVTSDSVVLQRAGEQLILRLPKKGE